MSAAARDSRSASKVSSSLGPGVGAGSGLGYFGAVGGDHAEGRLREPWRWGPDTKFCLFPSPGA